MVKRRDISFNRYVSLVKKKEYADVTFAFEKE